ncbi:hypothetical protein OAW29_03110 [Planktomarina temperata]|nr:hypothetical protein [Planktomarina temperata]
MMILLVLSVFNLRTIRRQDYRLAWILLIIISVGASITYNFDYIDFSKALKFASPIFLSIAIYVYNRAGILNVENLCNAILIFCIFLILFFLLVKLGVGPVVQFHESLCFEPRAGYFCHSYNSMMGNVQPGFYFRCTLIVVPIALIYIARNFYFRYLLCCIAIIIADTRAGIGIILIFSLLIVSKKIFGTRGLAILLIASAVITYSTTNTFAFLEQLYGLGTRFLHIESILLTMQSQSNFFGMGPGSSFYSEGFGFMADDSEVSPVEYYRRYGFFGLIVFHIFLISVIVQTVKNNWYLGVSIFAFYLAGLTNPIMVSSFGFLLYLSIRET